MVLEFGNGRSPRAASVERIVPGSKGGGYIAENCCWVCHECNQRRMDKSPERLRISFPKAAVAVQQLAKERQLDLPWPDEEPTEVNQ